MHICQLTRIVREHGIQGGMEQHSHLLTTGLTKRGHTVTTITTACQMCQPVENTIFLPNTSSSKYNNAWWEGSLKAIRQVHQQNPIDIIWSQSAGGRFYVLNAREEMKIPCVVIMHGTLKMELNSRLPRLNTLRGIASLGLFSTKAIPEYFHWRKTVPFVDHFIAASPATGKSAIETMGIDISDLTVVSNGIDTNLFIPDVEQGWLVRQKLQIPPESKLLITSSRLSDEKGIHLAIKALAALPDNVHLIVVGEGSARKYLQNMAIDLGLTGRVCFLGLIPNHELPMYLQASDVYLMPTMRDEGGVPLALLEAMASGLPVVATNIGGIPTAVIHEKTGLLFGMGNCDALIANTQRLLTDPQFAQAMEKAARQQVVNQFSANHMVNQIFAVFIKTIDATREKDGAN